MCIRIPISTFLVVAVYGVAPVAISSAQEKPERVKAGETLTSRLAWNNGETLPGELVGATDSELTWRSPLFSKPVSLDQSALRSVVSEAEAVPPKGSLAFNLRDGSRIYGDLASAEEGVLVVESERHGTVRIRTGEITAIHRLKGGDIIWSGPFGIAGWEYSNEKVAPGRVVKSSPGGALHSIAWRQRLNLPVDLPDQVEIEFRLSSTVRPEFELKALGEERTVNFVTWEDELVLRRGTHFVPLTALETETRELAFKIYWDIVTGIGHLVTPDGKVVARWQSADTPEVLKKQQEEESKAPEVARVQVREGAIINRIAAAMFPGLESSKRSSSSKKASKGVVLVNRGPDIKLDYLRIRKWDGELPEQSLGDPFLVRVEVAGGSAAEGRLAGGGGDRLVLKRDGEADRTIDLEKVESILFPIEPAAEEEGGKALAGVPKAGGAGGDEPDPLAAPATQPPVQLQEADEFHFADGTWVQGRFLGIEDGSVKIESRFSDKPVLASIDGLRELKLRSVAKMGEDGEEIEPVPLAQQDKLVTGDTTIHGAWHPAGSGNLQWRLAGASEPVEIASAAEMEITRVMAKDAKWPQSPALFHLTNGQVAPGELVAINGGNSGAVDYRSEISKGRQFSEEELHAIQFRGPEVKPEGWEDPGWQIVRGGEKVVEVKDEMVILDPGGSWGHPSILVGDEVRFTIQPSGYATLRARMFCEGVSSESPATSILLANYGNEIYCGLEDTPGQLNQRRDIAVTSNKPVKIKINWDATGTKIHVNGSMAIRIPVGEKAKRSGLGLVFEPANLWGNGERQVKVSDFFLRAAPGITWVPGVNPDAKERALFLPRFRKDDPPRHLLLAPNGDVLRGTIIAAAEEMFGFRSGLEELKIPRDRVAAAIWLKPPVEKEDEDADEEDEEEESEEKPVRIELRGENGENGEDGDAVEMVEAPKAEIEPAKTEPEDPAGPEPSHWLLLTSGARLALDVGDFGPEFVTGDSDVLGQCRIPVDHVHVIRSTKPDVSPATVAFSNWQLKRAPEPFLEGGGDDSPMIGKDAPEIDLTLLDGKRFRLSEQKGRIVVLDFWATWCGPCIRAIPDMIEEFSSFDSSRVRLVGINQAEPPDQVRNFVEQRGWTPFEVLLDLEATAGSVFGVEGIPHTVIVDHDGKVAWVSTGFRPDGAREAADIVRGLIDKAPGDRAARILDAEDIEDVGIEPARFDDYIGSFLADLVEEDRPKALEAFEKAVEVVATSRERELWKIKHGDFGKTFVADSVLQLNHHVEPITWLAFQADLLRSGKVPFYELPRLWGERKLTDALVGSENAAVESVESSVERVALALGNRELYPLAAGIFAKIIARQDLDTASHLLVTLKSVDVDELHPLLKELRFAVETNLELRESFRGRDHSAEAAAHYLATLKDETVPLPVRLLTADFLTSDAAPRPTREMVLQGAELVAAAWSGDTPVYQFWNQRFLEAFMRLHRDDAWTAVAKRLGAGFKKRYLGASPPEEIPIVPAEELLFLMMDLYVTIGDTRLAVATFEQYPKRVFDYEVPIVQFVRAGEFETALELVRKQSVKIGRNETRFAVYDEKLAKNAEAFLGEIEHPGLRLLTETIFAHADDPQGLNEKPPAGIRHGSPRSQRLQAAAQKFAHVSFPKPQVKRQVLRLLAADVGAAKIVAEDLEDVAGEIDAAKAMESRTFSSLAKDVVYLTADAGVLEGALLLALAKGDVEGANALIDRIAAAEADAGRKGEFVERLHLLPARVILGSEDPKKAAEAIIPVCQRIALGIKGFESRPSFAGKKNIPWGQLIYTMLKAGKMNDCLPWLRGACEGAELKKNMDLWKGGGALCFQILADEFRGRPLEDRIAMLNGVLGEKWILEEVSPFTNGGFRHSARFRLLTPEEVLEHGEAMAEVNPRDGFALNDLAYVCEGLGRFDEALGYWERASKQRLAAGNERESWQFRAHAVRMYNHQGRIEEATRAIAEISPDRYDSKDFAVLREQLAGGKLLVADLGEWEAMAKRHLAAAPPIQPKVVRKKSRKAAVPKAKGTGEDEPDPLATPSSPPALTAPEAGAGGSGTDEPDPFSPPPAAPTTKPDPKEKKLDGGGEPDPFGGGETDMPAQERKSLEPAEAGEKKDGGNDEPDPFD